METFAVNLVKDENVFSKFLLSSKYLLFQSLTAELCSCQKSNFPCTVFCNCECIECENPFNLKSSQEAEEDTELNDAEDNETSNNERMN